jgi:DNA-binding NtrC family response regulator
MRREMSTLKKQMEDIKSVPASTVPTIPASATIPSIPTIPSPSTMEDAVAEEYVEPIKEPENLNLDAWSRQALEKALDRNGGNRKKAAQELGISDRTLYRRLKQYGLDK